MTKFSTSHHFASFNDHNDETITLEDSVEGDKPKRPKCLCRFQENRRVRWDLFIMVLAIWNCVQIPYSIAFIPDNTSTPIERAINLLIDSVFIMDIVVMFRTTYVNEELGVEITSATKIAAQYLKGRFWIDIMASIPTDLVSIIFLSDENSTSAFYLEMLGLLKLIRLARLSRLIAYLNLKSDIKIIIKLTKLIFYLVLYLHCICCAWFYLVRQDEEWIPPLDEFQVETEIYTSSPFDQYVVAIYYSVLMLAGNDMLPQGNTQIMFSAFFILVALIINASMFGNLAVILQQIDRKNSSFHEKMENAVTTMRNMSIRTELQDRVQSYLISTQSTLDQQKEFDEFLQILSPSLRSEVTKHIFQECIMSNHIFENKTEVIDIILYDLKATLFLPEDEICRQNGAADKMFFMARGECDVYITDENKTSHLIHTLKVGSYFGEVALLKDCYRTATVKSKNYSTCAALEKFKFEKLIYRFPFIKHQMEENIKENYQDRWRRFVKRALRNVDYLPSEISDSVVEEISFRTEPINLSPNEYLFKSGKICKEVFIICNGEIEMSISNSKVKAGTYLDTLYAGCCIGSYSALTCEEHTISSKALTDCTVLKIDFSVFEDMRTKDEDLDEIMTKCEKYIEENGLPYCDYKLHRNKGFQISPIEKFKEGVNRITRILNSYKSSAFTDLLKKIQEQVQLEKEGKTNGKKTKKKKVMKEPKTHEERMEYMLTILTDKVNDLSKTVFKLDNERKCHKCGGCSQSLDNNSNSDKESDFDIYNESIRKNNITPHLPSNRAQNQVIKNNEHETSYAHTIGGQSMNNNNSKRKGSLRRGIEFNLSSINKLKNGVDKIRRKISNGRNTQVAINKTSLQEQLNPMSMTHENRKSTAQFKTFNQIEVNEPIIPLKNSSSNQWNVPEIGQAFASRNEHNQLQMNEEIKVADHQEIYDLVDVVDENDHNKPELPEKRLDNAEFDSKELEIVKNDSDKWPDHSRLSQNDENNYDQSSNDHWNVDSNHDTTQCIPDNY